MKKLLIVAMLFVAAACYALTATTTNVTLITATSAKFYGAIDTNASCWYYFHTVSGGTNKGAWGGYESLGACSSGSVSKTATGFSANTTYFYSLYASNSLAEDWSSVETFKTLPVQTFSASGVMADTNGNLLYPTNFFDGLNNSNAALQAQLDTLSTGKLDLATSILTNANFQSQITALSTNVYTKAEVDAKTNSLFQASTNWVHDQAYLTAETDPEFAASVAYAITIGLTNQWSTAYGWGNHTTNGYLTAESDPLWIAVSNAVTVNSANGATAFGWGNHGTNDYVTADVLAGSNFWSAAAPTTLDLGKRAVTNVVSLQFVPPGAYDGAGWLMVSNVATATYRPLWRSYTTYPSPTTYDFLMVIAPGTYENLNVGNSTNAAALGGVDAASWATDAELAVTSAADRVWAANWLNQTNYSEWIDFPVWDPTNSLTFERHTPFPFDVTIAKIRAKSSGATGVINIGVAPWDSNTDTIVTPVESTIIVNASGTEDSAISGVNVLSNNAVLVFQCDGITNFVFTNRWNISILVTH